MKPHLTPHGVSLLHTLIAFMDGLRDARFTMMQYRHDCGTPACAWGWARTLSEFKPYLLQTSPMGAVAGSDEMFRAFGDGGYQLQDSLFSYLLHGKIHTPQQWAAHARAKLVEWGYSEHETAAAQEEPERVRQTLRSKAGCPAESDEPASAAAPDPAWERVRAKMLEPVGV